MDHPLLLLSLPVRAGGAFAAALLAALVLTPWLARRARELRFGDRLDKSDSDAINALHRGKRSTPIVGGISILLAVLLAALPLADLRDPGVLALGGTIAGLGLLGLGDDLQKTFGRARTRGLTARQKLAGQVTIGVLVALGLLWATPAHEQAALTTLHVPGLSVSLPLAAAGFVALVAFLVTGSSNAVNLTDGLDGLAGGCSLVALAFYLGLALVASDPGAAEVVGLAHAPLAGEATVVLAALLGALLAFLRFNAHPARVFMGDTGSLPLGGALAVAAVLTRQELLLALVGGVFVAEALSVMAQVASFKLTGRRVLRCAPLHHHFELGGWRETQVVSRFHAAALALALLGLAGLTVG